MYLERNIDKLEAVKSPFPRITYDEAVDILKQNNIDLHMVRILAHLMKRPYLTSMIVLL